VQKELPINSYNRLADEKSPYLLQHQNNPVHWYAWGEEAFAAARAADKPIFLSVGYSTCHWCHVMAHQSFEDQEVADYLNEHFICIKVDREERPDVDEIYMGAVHALGQRGGWPLSVFLTPQLTPFFGGTYWPKENFLYILRQIQQLWQGDQEKVLESGRSLVEHLKAQKNADLSGSEPTEAVLDKFLQQSDANYDQAWGGFSHAPKFPHATQVSLLLRIHHRSGSERALQMAVHTLEKMAYGGLFDHLGGGFARYSVDERWMIPHFEKMLYDNALLAHTYLEAHQLTGITLFENVARETLDYVLAEMTSPEGGFYSAQDADSEGEEGKYYVWTQQEMAELLSEEEMAAMARVYGISAEGNFEHGTNHLNMQAQFAWEEKEHPLMLSARQKLLAARKKRVPPHKDDKILSAWNGLMIRAMAKAYRVTGENRYLEAARRAAEFLQNRLYVDGALLARYREGEAKFSGRLEDYAYVIEGLLELYACEFSTTVLDFALELQEIQNQKFWDAPRGAYYFTDGADPHLLVRTMEGMDGALPNANGVSALNLFRLVALDWRESWHEMGLKILQAFARMVLEYPTAFAQILLACDHRLGPAPTWAVIHEGPAAALAPWLRRVNECYAPRLTLALGPEGASRPALLRDKKLLEGQSTLYWCEGDRCEAPTHDLEGSLGRLTNN